MTRPVPMRLPALARPISPKRLGYVRSARFRDPEAEAERLYGAGVVYIYEDTTDTQRSEFTRLLDDARVGDVVVVAMLGALGKPGAEVWDAMERIRNRGCFLEILNLGVAGESGAELARVLNALELYRGG